MEIRVGTYIQSTKNIVAELPLPFGCRFIVFSQREGGVIGYVFGPNAESALESAAEVALTLGL